MTGGRVVDRFAVGGALDDAGRAMPPGLVDDADGGALRRRDRAHGERPRMQPRVTVVPLDGRDAVVFAVSRRRQRGVRGDDRVTMRRGVGPVRPGRRTACIVVNDAA